MAHISGWTAVDTTKHTTMPDIRTTATGLQLGPVLLHNIRRLDATDEGLRPGRLAAAVRAQVEEKTQATEGRGTGCELRFRLRGEHATIRLRTQPLTDRAQNSMVEIWHGAFPTSNVTSPIAVGTDWTEVRIPRPDAALLQRIHPDSAWSPELVRVRLQYDRVFELGAIDGDLAPPEPGDAPTHRLCCYGSSITHGSSAILPSMTGMWQAADALGMDLLNLGFPGSAYLEPAIAQAIASDPSWEVATAELGINVIGRWSPDEFAAKVDAFLAILATAGRPVLVTGIYRSAPDLHKPERIAAFRSIVAEATARHGLHHVDSTSFLTSWSQLTTDLVHPNLAGMTAIGARWAQEIRQLRASG
jgi:hypothetical protein